MKRPPLSSTPNRHLIARGTRTSRDEADASAWMSEHRGRAAIKPPPSVDRAMSALIKPLSQKFSGPTRHELDAQWAEIVGPQLAKLTRPEKFQSGALVVRAQGPAATLVEAQSAQILARVAAYSGKKPSKLKIIQGPLNSAPKPKARPVTNRIIKVTSASERTLTLEETLENWRKEIERREGVSLPPKSTRD
ncbi:DciA family protein [Oceanicaulis sp. LC35]|uniref:DciA family protein n=1 Tax=Oceanicaulis sp. LC35 TaxID=3349635 RepID=UPI003F864188